MTLDDLERLHQRARQADAGSDEHQALVEAVLDCFDRHGTMAPVVAREVFLHQRAPEMRAEALLVLGRMGSTLARWLA